AKPVFTVCLMPPIAWFYGRFAPDRSLRQRLQGAPLNPGRPAGRRLALALAFDLKAPLTTMAERRH
ncbi:hypothetical protein, partial [Pseudomonas chlororaphis]|uniref:hypothetical protein n=1 Tax=Pseudomonas chlororaphis TaxID=587753 RepID=UPI001CC1FD84